MVRPTETKSWMYRYYPPSNPKQSIISIGIYPSISYARACEVWREYEDLLSKGIDPKINCEEIKKRIISKTNNYFRHFAWKYFDNLDQTQKSNTLIRKKGRLELICSYIGDEPISEIDSPRMLEVLLDIQANSLNKDGKPTDKAERCAGIASDVFIYAGARGFCSSNPADLIKSQLAKAMVIVQPLPSPKIWLNYYELLRNKE